MRLGNLLESLLERLWSVPCTAVAPRERGRQPEIKACAVTCHDFRYGLGSNETGEVDVHVSQGVPLDDDRFNGAFDGSRLGKLVDRGANPQTVLSQELPARLRQRERFGVAELAKGGRANALCRLPSLPITHMLKEALIPLINALYDVLDGLRAQLRPPAIFWALLQCGDVGFQPVVWKMFLVSSVISPMQRNAMVMNDTTI